MNYHGFLVIWFFISSFLLPGHIRSDASSNCDVSLNDIYSIMDVVIKKEKINRTHGINLRIQPYCNINNRNDTNYLRTLLIKPDTAKRKPGFPDVILWPDKNQFTRADIDYMLCTRQKFKNLQWDNSKLGFNKSNLKNYYVFSLPYFNKKHDKVLITYEALCPGLCGSGSTIVLKKRGNDWEVSPLEHWFH